MVKIQLQHRRSQFNSWAWKFAWRRNGLQTPVLLDFPGGSDSKESVCSVGDLSSTTGLGRSPGGGHSNPLQYSCLENPMDRGDWRAIIHRVTKTWSRMKWLTSHAYLESAVLQTDKWVDVELSRTLASWWERTAHELRISSIMSSVCDLCCSSSLVCKVGVDQRTSQTENKRDQKHTMETVRYWGMTYSIIFIQNVFWR